MGVVFASTARPTLVLVAMGSTSTCSLDALDPTSFNSCFSFVSSPQETRQRHRFPSFACFETRRWRCAVSKMPLESCTRTTRTAPIDPIDTSRRDGDLRIAIF